MNRIKDLERFAASDQEVMQLSSNAAAGFDYRMTAAMGVSITLTKFNQNYSQLH